MSFILMKTAYEHRNTSFSCFSFLEYFIGHDEGVIFITWNEDVVV